MDVRIGHFEARYRLPQGLQGEADRLDRTLASLAGELLERALELAGIRDDEELCIRHLNVPLRIHAGATDAAVETEWVLALARAFERARQTAEQHRGSGPFATSSQGQEFRTELGHTDHRFAIEDENEPLTVVRYRSKHAALLDMAVRIARGDFSREWAWKQIGLWPTSASGARERVRYLVEALLSSPGSIPSVVEMLARFDLLQKVWLLLAPGDWLRLASAALAEAGLDSAATLEAVLTALRRQSGDGLEIVVQTQPWLAMVDSPRHSLDAAVETARAALVCLLSIAADPTLRVLAFPKADHPSVADSGTVPPAKVEDTRRREPGLLIPGATRYGGLLFLLNLLDRTGLIHAIRADDIVGVRTIRWILHQLALQIVPVEHDDPAALAFAGLLPGARPPSHAEPGPDDSELAALEYWAQRIVAATCDLLEECGLPGNDLAMDFVCRRDASVDGDPGWIEITFPLETVSVDIRRVGLDADPGWIPWLGAVMRFRYE